MSKFTSGLSRELIFKSKAALLIKNMDISRLVVYMQQVVEEERKQSEFSERQGKKFRPSEQGSRYGSKWSRKKWGSFGSFSTSSAPHLNSLVNC